MTLRRARRLSSELATYQGAVSVSVAANMASRPGVVVPAAVGLEVHGGDFQVFRPSSMRAVKRRVCSSSLTSSQYLSRITPESTMACSTKGRAGGTSRLLLGAKPHDGLDPGPVVPAPIENHDLTSGGKVGHVALEVHLRAFTLVRGGQSHDPEDPGAHTFGEPFDHAALSCGVPAFEHDAHLGVLLHDPALQMDQFDVQAPELLLVLLASHLLGTLCAALPHHAVLTCRRRPSLRRSPGCRRPYTRERSGG